ncbi:MAG: PfaD family polyunsaturated fatty acid/polyketide biosynthesis protein [Bryobacterales bacterium]|nr:PfaD family polyunsaturated fatty acid/polyketide biosynthesis protein [Bryobacterales bacterium]
MNQSAATAIRAEAPCRDSSAFRGTALRSLLFRIRETLEVIKATTDGAMGLRLQGDTGDPQHRVAGVLPPLYPEWLGDRSFQEVHGTRFPYVVGEMADGIATTTIVIAAAKAGFLGFFGAAGLGYEYVEQALTEISRELDGAGLPWGSNLIHSPAEPLLEESVADLYIARNVRRVSASAFMALTPSVVRIAAAGLHLDGAGRIQRKHYIFAKISRPETAAQFMAPPPQEMLDALVAKGSITREEARLAARIPVAEDISVEADSGGHTDNRPLVCLLPVILELRDQIAAKYEYDRPIRVGAAGGIGTPGAAAAAFGMGAAFVMTGSINQSAIEAGTSPAVKAMLAEATVSDVMMAPAADMFEIGVKVQVLKRGTMFAVRAAQLYRVYSEYTSLDTIPAALRKQLESEIFLAPFQEIWDECVRFWQQRDPGQVVKAEKDARHKMALVFRWYLGKASRWARSGDPKRRLDYQIWCGPAMGAFNAWVKDSFLAAPANRNVAQIGLNLLEGAAVITRAQQARSYGIALPESAFSFPPRLLSPA